MGAAVHEEEGGEARPLVAPVGRGGVVKLALSVEEPVVCNKFVCVWHKDVLFFDALFLPFRSFEVNEVREESASFIEVLGVNVVRDDD